MDQRYLLVACGTILGILIGTGLYLSQPAGWQSMNVLGVVTFASLGTSFGCLMAEPAG
jgi:hypothetical protein